MKRAQKRHRRRSALKYEQSGSKPQQRSRATRLSRAVSSRASSQHCRGLLYLLLLRTNQRHILFHLGRETAHIRVSMIPAARLTGTIAAEKGPVLRAPIVEPKPVLLDDELAKRFAARVRPNTP